MRRALAISFLAAMVFTMCARGVMFEITHAQSSEGVRFDLPANAALRIENRRGSVFVETWNEIYVWLEIENASSTSPVRVERDEQRLTIQARNDETSDRSPVNMRLRVPLHAQVEVVTASEAIEIRGVPLSLFANSEAGDIRMAVSPQADATIAVQSREGNVENRLTTEDLQTIPPRAFTMTLGTGNRIVRLASVRGNVVVSSNDSSSDENGSIISQRRRPPTLQGVPVSSPSPAPSPENSPLPGGEDEDVITIETDLVNVNVSVVDRSSGRGLTGLTAADFRCLEDGVEQQIRSFESSAAPFDLVLLIDLSGSTREVVDVIRGAALRFVSAAREQDRIAVVTFASAPVLVSELTTDRAALRQRINRIEQPRGSTRLYDAVQYAMNLTSARTEQRRSAIVLMSDGLDSQLPNVQGDGSSLAYEELARQVEEMDGVLYSLWLNTEYDSLSERDVQPETFDLAHDRMRALAEAGGGVFHEVEELSDLAGVYERVIADLGTLYSFAYRPTNEVRDGRWRTVRITLPRYPNAVARGRRGYRR
jgi:VWFA-related protein